MNSAIFEEIYSSWKNNFDDGTGYSFFAKKFGYETSEGIRSAFRRWRKKRGLRREENIIEKKETGKPVVGVVDIETLPAEVYVFQLYDQNISISQIITDVCLLSWAGKYLNESETFSDILTSKEAPKKDEKRIVESCWKFLNTCDVIIGHNWSGFDGRILNTLFLQYGFPPLKYVTVDTLSCARHNFKFSSNKLDFINKKLGIRNKLTNEGFILWKHCHEGDQKSLDSMMEYNIGDIFSTEELFYRLRPYIRNFNVALYNEIEENQCPVCGSVDLKVEGFYYTSAGKWESVRCQECQCISRKKNNLFTTEKKKSLLINS